MSDKIGIPLVRHILPELFVNKLVGVQPIISSIHSMPLRFTYETINQVPEFNKIAEREKPYEEISIQGHGEYPYKKKVPSTRPNF
jgi:hypothetical protein